MPTTFTDQFFTMDPSAPPPVGTLLTVSNFVLVDQNDDDDVDQFDGDSVDGQDVSSSYPLDTVTINVSGVGNITYVGTTFYLADGREVFTPTDGQVLQEGTFVSSTWVTTQGPLDTGTDLGPPCFTPGALIATPNGTCAVENLAVGDFVMTKDNGAQEIIWIAQRSIEGQGDFAPIMIKRGTLGNSRDLLVSPQHRMLVSGWRAQLFFGEDEVLVAAKHLVNGDTIFRAPCEQVTYLHLMCQGHQVIFAEDAPTESLDPQAPLLAHDRHYQKELSTLFPELANFQTEDVLCARMILKKHEGKILNLV